MQKQNFLMYLDYQEHFELLSNDEIGQLVIALFNYLKKETIPE